MNSRLFRQTGSQKWLMVPRLMVALPLAGFGSFHLTGMTPLVVLAAGLVILVKGAGNWSLDRKATV